MMFLWAHRQRLSVSQTHKAPAATVGCCRGTAASNPQSTRRGQSPSAPLRHTRPTLKNIVQPNSLPPKLPFLPSPFWVPPLSGYPVPAGGHGRQQAKQEKHQPKSLPNFAPPSSTQKHMRSAQPTQRQKTSILRRSCSFGFGLQHFGSLCASCRRWQLRHDVPPYRGTQPAPNAKPVPKSLRPPLHLSKRMAGSRGALPQMRDSVRPLCVQRPQGTKPASRSADRAAGVG